MASDFAPEVAKYTPPQKNKLANPKTAQNGDLNN